ncbi:MAG TPA: hypothetical protein VI541_01970, partial [Actinomycetota bacterium]|nr:hypothetical protein [Actinomycetota bacterium]
MKRRTTAAARATALLAVLLSTLTANLRAEARVTSINLSSTAVAAAPDYASVTYSDPWDYSNKEDQLLDQFAGTLSLSSPRIGLGFLSFETNNGASFDPIRTIGGAEPTGRDSGIHPIDASRFTRLSMRINSNSLENAGVLWFNCPTAVGTCAGGFPFQIKPGWQTYDFDIPAQTRFGSLPLTWSGMLSGLRIIPTNSAGKHFDFDWIRLYQSSPSVTITWVDNNPGAGADLYWDTDTDPENNSANNPGWGLVQHVASTSASNTTSFVSGAFPPGTYYFYVKDLGDSTTSAVSQGLTIDGIPLPVVDQPDLAGGEDYATAVRGDAWDFSSSSDAALRNVQSVWYAGGILNATNGPPTQNDPQVQL